nr:GNAT family N-acetyltransferase [Bradyrhizobium iriomotense]
MTQLMPLRGAALPAGGLRAGLGGRLSVVPRGDAIEVRDDAGRRISLGLEAEAESLRLRVPSGLREHVLPALCGAIESLTAGDRNVQLALDCGDGDLAGVLVREGIAIHQGGSLIVEPALVWQQPRLWLPQATSFGGHPQLHVMSGDRRHPLRPPKPTGTCYARFIPWLGQVLSFVAVDVERDLPLYHRWMNDPRVEAIWGDGGDLERHRRDLEERTADPHVLPLIGYADDVPFGYFEVYWAKENRLGPHYAAADFDRGWHVAIGEEAFRGKAWITAWLPSLMHFIFLDDIRTQRIVGEPKASHAQQIRNLDRAGFAKIKHIDFPHKRALLVMLLRERFFADRLWAPEAASPSEGSGRA